MSIPFTQFLLPDGRRKSVEVDAPAEIEAIADRFIRGGGWFECEVLTTGHVSVTACMHVDDEPQDVEIAVCKNDESVLSAVEKVVRASVTHLPDPS